MTIISQVSEKTMNYFNDIITVKWEVLWIALIAMGLSLLCFVLIKFLAGFFVWGSILIFIASLFVLGVFTMRESNRLADISNLEQTTTNENNAFFDSQTLYRLAIAIYVLAGIITLVFLFNLGTIAISIAIIKTAALFVFQTFWITLLPVVFFIIIFAYLVYWLYVLGFLYSIGEPVKTLGLPFVTIKRTDKDLGLLIAHIFSSLWNVAFINYLMIFVIACTCVIWYYNNKDSPNYFPRPIMTSLWWAFRYHLGSIALGAFILAIIWFI